MVVLVLNTTVVSVADAAMGNFETKEKREEAEEEVRNLVNQCLESRNGTLICGNLEFNRDHLVYLTKVLPMNKTLKILDFEVPETLQGGYILEEDGAELLSRGLKNNDTISAVNLTRNFIREEGAKKLAEGLGKNSSITSLNLTENIIGDGGVKAIAEACRKNSVSILKLSKNAISSDGVASVAKIIKSKHKPRHLTVLDLSDNCIDSFGARPLSDSLRYSLHLKSLDLYGNSLESDGLVILADALVMNTSLTELNIGSNSIEDIGAQALAEALSRNYSLATLLLRDNPLRDVGVKSLCQSLRNNRIKYLSFAKTQITDSSLTELCYLLIHSKTISSLDISHNLIGDEGIEQLAMMLAHYSCSLTSLNISYNPIGERAVLAMLQCLNLNCTLEHLSGFQGTSGYYKIPLVLEDNKVYKELGYTPLMRAAMNGDETSVELLLQNGYDPLKRNIEGKSPLDLASNPSIKVILSKAIASVSGSMPPPPPPLGDETSLQTISYPQTE